MFNKKLLSFSLCTGIATSMLLSGGTLKAFAAENDDWEIIEQQDVVHAHSQYINALLHGPTLENVKFDKHKFTIYKATVTKVADRTFNVTGKLSHNLSGRPDDQVEYTFTKKDGKIIAASINFGVQRGGWIHYKAPQLVELAKWNGWNISEEALRKVASITGLLIEGDWEKELQNIINIFTLVDDSQLNEVAISIPDRAQD
ncbi:hypothetical protein [Bacillus cereus]|uniref:hypothetical protein n=1 Tax=Bacillus cereus TaxID=1396 RepID=UPI0028529A7D|nr:hypothetical protein [Bacillus cereus]WLE91056.1 hypothetical protein GGBNIMDK_00087 [Bacillus cereus]WLE91068.1 hypothetical protein GGBNIMDK_00099 [Bacillus cereus]